MSSSARSNPTIQMPDRFVQFALPREPLPELPTADPRPSSRRGACWLALYCTFRKIAVGTPQLPLVSWLSTKIVCLPGASPEVNTVA